MIGWSAVIICLIGVYLILDPISLINNSSNLSSFGYILSVCSTFTYACLALILTKLSKSEHTATTALIHNFITSCIIFLAITIFGTNFYGKTGTYVIDILIIPNSIFTSLIMLGVVGYLAQYLMTLSYKYIQTAILAKVTYLSYSFSSIF